MNLLVIAWLERVVLTTQHPCVYYFCEQSFIWFHVIYFYTKVVGAMHFTPLNQTIDNFILISFEFFLIFFSFSFFSCFVPFTRRYFFFLMFGVVGRVRVCAQLHSDPATDKSNNIFDGIYCKFDRRTGTRIWVSYALSLSLSRIMVASTELVSLMLAAPLAQFQQLRPIDVWTEYTYLPFDWLSERFWIVFADAVRNVYDILIDADLFMSLRCYRFSFNLNSVCTNKYSIIFVFIRQPKRERLRK